MGTMTGSAERNNDWKDGNKNRAGRTNWTTGRYDGAKKCRHIVPTGNKVER